MKLKPLNPTKKSALNKYLENFNERQLSLQHSGNRPLIQKQHKRCHENFELSYSDTPPETHISISIKTFSPFLKRQN